MKHLGLFLALGLMLIGGAAQAATSNFYIHQTKEGLDISAKGRFDLSGHTEKSDFNINPKELLLLTSESATTNFFFLVSEYTIYTFANATGPKSFGNAAINKSASGSKTIGFQKSLIGTDGFIYVPKGYVSNALLDGAKAFLPKATLKGEGLKSGKHVYKIGKNTINVEIAVVPAPAPIPLPAAGWALLAGCGALMVLRRRS